MPVMPLSLYSSTLVGQGATRREAGAGLVINKVVRMEGRSLVTHRSATPIGKTTEMIETDCMQTVFPHRTVSRMSQESVLAAYEKALQI